MKGLLDDDNIDRSNNSRPEPQHYSISFPLKKWETRNKGRTKTSIRLCLKG